MSFFKRSGNKPSGLYEHEKKTDNKDEYYRVESERAINAAIEAALAAGKSGEDLRRAIRRSYCFSLPRKGREYKTWRREMLAAEARLGLEPKKHRSKDETED